MGPYSASRNFLFVYADTPQEWNCSQHRCLTPSNALNAAGHVSNLMWLDDFCRIFDRYVVDRVMSADYIMVQRNAVREDVHQAIDYFRGLGKLIVVDLDDMYAGLPWSNPAFAFWILNASKQSAHPLELLRRGLSKATALTSPSKVILGDWKALIPELQVVWLPNLLCQEWWSNLPVKNDDGWLTLGWGGSVSHYDSWWGSGIREALQVVLSKRKFVRVKICGNDPRIFQQLKVNPRQKVYQEGVPPSEWPKVVATFDAVIAPLYGDYDRRRSWLKAAEGIVAGIPVACTCWEPYAELRDYILGVDQVGNMKLDIEAWVATLLDLIDNYSKHKAAALRFRDEVGPSLLMEPSVPQYVRIWESITLTSFAGVVPGVEYVRPGP